MGAGSSQEAGGFYNQDRQSLALADLYDALEPASSGQPGLDGVSGAKGGPGCPGERGDIGPPGTPGIIDEFEIHAMVVRAMREIHEECFGDDSNRPGEKSGPSNDDWFTPSRGDIDENI